MEDFLKEYKNKIQEIKKLYPELQNHSDVWVLGLYQSICEQQIINEFITQTINIDKTLKELSKIFPNNYLGAGDRIERPDDKRIYIRFITPQFHNIDEINKFMDSFGWYPSFIEEAQKKYSKDLIKGKHITIIYEAKYDTEVKLGSEDEKYLYHLVPDVLYKRVKLSGLTPKNKSKLGNHPERIYMLYPTNNNDEYEDIAIRLWETTQEKTRDLIHYYYLLQIDINSLKDFKFYNDPNFWMGNGGIWTYQNIPPSSIKLVKKILVNPEL